ncbi:MAG: response regulator [Pseudobdellovibrio sp.]
MKELILITEDDVELLQVLVDDLKDLGMEIITATNGKIGLELAKKHNFSMILSDISMPEMNGLEFLKSIRLHGLEVPFIVLSGNGDRQNTMMALRWGAFDFLDKPYEYEELLKKVKDASALGLYQYEIAEQINSICASKSFNPEEALKFKDITKRQMLMRFESKAHDKK